MDFITLATEQHQWLRKLDQMLGDDDTDAHDNTIINIITDPGNKIHDDDHTNGGSMGGPYGELRHPPFFSENSERELYRLASNFLLYVAMVIVVVLVCRIYFPEALQSRASMPPLPRSYRYNRVTKAGSGGDDDDIDDDDEEDSDEVLNSSGGDGDEGTSMRRAPRRQSSTFLDFQQENLTRKQVIGRLIFCCIMLNLVFVTWGALQVRVCNFIPVLCIYS
jgi:hypothetical protein